jgi:hypothetical protein
MMGLGIEKFKVPSDDIRCMTSIETVWEAGNHCLNRSGMHHSTIKYFTIPKTSLLDIN